MHEKDNDGLTALHHAALEGYPAIVQVLLDLGSEVTGPSGAGLTLEEQVIKRMEDAEDAYKKGSYQDVVDLLKSKDFAALGEEAAVSEIMRFVLLMLFLKLTFFTASSETTRKGSEQKRGKCP